MKHRSIFYTMVSYLNENFHLNEKVHLYTHLNRTLTAANSEVGASFLENRVQENWRNGGSEKINRHQIIIYLILHLTIFSS